jgi:putative heme-binding domain-containing protein
VGVSLCAQQHSTTRSNPFSTEADRAEGARIFKTQCAACHGPGGAGGAAGPDLTTGKFRRGDSDDQLFQVVTKGIPGTTMPAFGGSSREAWQIVAYVRSLSIGGASALAAGDPARGALVYARSGCSDCHWIGGKGGTLGPELTSIGSVRSPASLRNAVTDPNREVAPEYWTLRGRTRQGGEISGIRLNEDTHSFQFRDQSGLRSVLKAELASHELARTSPMPAAKLTPAELDDLVAYLASLREGVRP